MQHWRDESVPTPPPQWQSSSSLEDFFLFKSAAAAAAVFLWIFFFRHTAIDPVSNETFFVVTWKGAWATTFKRVGGKYRGVSGLHVVLAGDCCNCYCRHFWRGCDCLAKCFFYYLWTMVAIFVISLFSRAIAITPESEFFNLSPPPPCLFPPCHIIERPDET